MIKERDLLEKVISGDNKGDFFVSYDLYKEIYEFLAQPEEGVYQKLLRIEDGVEVEILPSELWQDGYEAGKRSVLLSKQPEQHGTQYLLDQVTRLTAENAMLKEKWSTSKQPEQNKAEAIMPNGVCVSNVYDAYEEGRKSVMGEQEPEAWMLIDKETGARIPRAYKPEHGVNQDRWELYPLYASPTKRTSFGFEIADVCGSEDYREGFKDGALYAEKARGIGE